ncbi:MAG: SGNH/GDSL hydrolase family protein [Verrucomicrobiales bacterium]|nr:SGNH/GDSL hydrolase family protein [Verrucomicrobiales bacterium]
MFFLRLFALVFFTCLSSFAAVVRVEVTEREAVGKAGYERILGRLHFEIDPTSPQNAIIADIALAPRNERGQVEFSSDFILYTPKDPANRHGTAWVEIPNRGGRTALSEWAEERGFTVFSVGWEFDIPEAPGKLSIRVPTARETDGTALRGVISATFTPDRANQKMSLPELADYPPVNLAGPDSRLVKRDRMAFPQGQELPRASWTLDGDQVVSKSGWEPGSTYEVFYLTENPPLAGLGYAATRDAVSWLKHSADSLAPSASACAFGSSQCGRYLRDFLYLGFNTDEADRPALDGVIAHVAGAGRLICNQRWSQPRRIAGFYTTSFPFADTALVDPFSGHRDGVLENPRVQVAQLPKIFYINTSAEYWGAGRAAALTHTDPTGQQDVAFPANVRSYHLAGTQHGPASFPPTAQAAGSPMANPVNAKAVVTALRLAMADWVSKDIPPPDSEVPTITAGTLIPLSDFKWPSVPQMPNPRHFTAGPRLPNPQWSDEAGAGAPLPLLVPQVDADGNEVSSIRVPDVAVPLGTATGWVYRPASLGHSDEPVLLRGGWVPFAVTEAERRATGDPRPSLEKRYPSKKAYLRQVRQALKDLANRRLLLTSDIKAEMTEASQRWDWAVNRLPAFQRVLFLGNSITLHQPAPSIGWQGKWGMAASAETKDYVHLTLEALAQSAGHAPDHLVKNIAAFERNPETFDIEKELADARAFRPDLIILAIGENAPAISTPEQQAALQAHVTDLLKTVCGTAKTRLLVRTNFWANPAKDAALTAACETVGGTLVNISALSKEEANYARSEQDFEHTGVAKHPGDRGMAAIAQALLEALRPAAFPAAD